MCSTLSLSLFRSKASLLLRKEQDLFQLNCPSMKSVRYPFLLTPYEITSENVFLPSIWIGKNNRSLTALPSPLRYLPSFRNIYERQHVPSQMNWNHTEFKGWFWSLQLTLLFQPQEHCYAYFLLNYALHSPPPFPPWGLRGSESVVKLHHEIFTSIHKWEKRAHLLCSNIFSLFLSMNC